jgi:hypothetical protein
LANLFIMTRVAIISGLIGMTIGLLEICEDFESDALLSGQEVKG